MTGGEGEDSNHQGGGVACKKIVQTEGALKGNNYSQDHLSMGGSKGYMFLGQY